MLFRSRLQESNTPDLALSCPPSEGPLLGNVRPRQFPPGRGMLLTRRQHLVLQTGYVTEPVQRLRRRPTIGDANGVDPSMPATRGRSPSPPSTARIRGISVVRTGGYLKSPAITCLADASFRHSLARRAWKIAQLDRLACVQVDNGHDAVQDRASRIVGALIGGKQYAHQPVTVGIE